MSARARSPFCCTEAAIEINHYFVRAVTGISIKEVSLHGSTKV